MREDVKEDGFIKDGVTRVFLSARVYQWPAYRALEIGTREEKRQKAGKEDKNQLLSPGYCGGQWKVPS